MCQKVILFFIFWFFLCPETNGQTPKNQEKQDTAKLYRNIEKISKKNKYTKFIYSLIFRPVSPVPKERKKVNKKQDPLLSEAQNKIIRNIEIITLDPFGLNINDTSVHPTFFLPLAGNTIHIKSRKLTIKNLLLIKKNDLFDSLEVKESERLIRAQNYIREVKLAVKLEKNSDSVDIIFTVQDLWSIGLNGNASASQLGINVSDKNFLGLGYQFQHAINHYNATNTYDFETNYYIRNIRNSFINSNLQYKVDADNSYLKRFMLDRSFFSSFTQWAGGMLFDQRYHMDSALYSSNRFKFQEVKYNMQDYWLGKAWHIILDRTAYSRSTNLTIASRFMHVHYLRRPDSTLIPDYVFADERFLLASIGINTRLYLQDKYVFNYGLTEDIPTGKIFNTTLGYQINNSTRRLYAGVKIAMADYFNWGYLSHSIELGTYFRKGKSEQGTLNASVTYFTELIPLGKWNFRQFIKPAAIIGIHRLPTDRLFVKSDSVTSSVQFFQKEPDFWSGVHRFMLTLQTQSYAPWSFYGFRFGPYFSVSAVLLTEKNLSLGQSKLFTQFDIGILIKNEFLLFNYFQISFSFNPVIPGGRKNVFRANAYETTDFGLPGFDTGKPSVVNYQ